MRFSAFMQACSEAYEGFSMIDLPVVNLAGKRVVSIEMVQDEELGDVYAIEFED